jgi:hypothetical protein
MEKTYGNISLTMVCPHCGTHFSAMPTAQPVGVDVKGHWGLEWRQCTACNNIVIHLAGPGPGYSTLPGLVTGNTIPETCPRRLIYPKATGRRPVPQEVPSHIAADFTEACLVLGDSPKASAALSRRCLQLVLREAASATSGNLYGEIEEVINPSKGLPSSIASLLHALRTIGNLAAHPEKSKATNQIFEVQPMEAEWTLEVLEMLFDYYYVQPVEAQKRKDALNARLLAAGKQPVK